MIIYSTPQCFKCKDLKQWLVSHKVDFKEVDLSKDSAKASEVVSKSGSMMLPQAEINGKFYVGVDAIKEASNA